MRKPEGLQALAAFDPPTLEGMRELSLWLFDDHDGFEQQVQERFAAAMVPGHWESMMAVRVRNPEAGPLPEDTFLADLSRVRVPVTFVEGTRDRMLEAGWSEVLAQKTPGSQAITIDASHEPNIDDPEALVDVFRRLVTQQ